MPAPHAPPADYEVALADRAATRHLAGRLARLLRAGDVIGLGGATVPTQLILVSCPRTPVQRSQSSST
ncbi:MAG: hypothetical protein IH906_03185 [Proteobacteria bacterium]|nr:hypothetical protein [Pseudomonadota bacterium]